MTTNYPVRDFRSDVRARLALSVAVACLIATAVGIAQVQPSPHRRFNISLESNRLREIASIESKFHIGFSTWKRSDGVASPCPEIQNEANNKLLELLNLRQAHPSEVIDLLGNPNNVYENGKNPGIFYWQFEHYWATTSPRCVMLLPRNANYDEMLALFLDERECIRVSISVAIEAAGEKRVLAGLAN